MNIKSKTQFSTFHLPPSTYQKKFGLIRRNITPEAQSKAKPITTFIIIFLPPLGLPVAIIIPPITIKTNETIKIIVTNICVNAHIKVGKASCDDFPPYLGSSIHLPINGTLVFNSTPQQTLVSVQSIHTHFTSLNQGGHTQRLNELSCQP